MDIPSWARVGAKVVCIDADAHPGRWNGRAPVVRRNYTIIAIGRCGPSSGEPQAYFADEAGLIHGGKRIWIKRFRPLVTRSQEQDVAAIKKLLTDMSEEIDA